jgi:hypothetical protein
MSDHNNRVFTDSENRAIHVAPDELHKRSAYTEEAERRREMRRILAVVAGVVIACVLAMIFR